MAIITISREMGSGGIPIAHQLADELGYTLVNGEAIMDVAEAYGLSPESVEQADEKPPHFVEKLDEKSEIDLHQIELIILEYALKGNVIIYGRGGQDLLKEIKSVFRVRITCPFDVRVERWAEREWLDPDLARILVRKSDQQRAGFIKYFFDRDWADPIHYDLVVNTKRLSEEMAVKLISAGVKDKNLTEKKETYKKLLSDLIIRKKAEIAILSGVIESYQLELSAKQGVLTLDGLVHSAKEKLKAIELAKDVKGVTEVIDKIKVVEYRTEPDDH